MDKYVTLRDEITLLQTNFIQERLLTALSSVANTSNRVIFQIASNGGCIASAMSLFYWLDRLDTSDLVVHAFSHMASAANLLLLTKHPTYSYPHCSFMFHVCSTNLKFETNHQGEMLRNNDWRVDHYWKIYNERTNGKINAEWVQQKQFTYLYPEDLLEMGIIDGIL